MKDMQNKKHLPLANVLALSSLCFLILSSLFSFSLEAIFLKSFADIEPKPQSSYARVGEQGGRERGRERRSQSEFV